MYAGEIVTAPSVVKEVKDSDSLSRLEIALDISRFRVEQPSPRYVEKAKRAARDLGGLGRLSQTDIDVLALALEYRDRGFEVVVFTDDYDVQAVLRALGIEFRPVKTRGIKQSSSTS